MRLKTKERQISQSSGPPLGHVSFRLLESYLVVIKSRGCDSKQHLSVGERQPCKKCLSGSNSVSLAPSAGPTAATAC